MARPQREPSPPATGASARSERSSRRGPPARDQRAARMLGELEAAGFKLTSQRRAIVQLFADDLSHPTAQELFERLRPQFPSMSFATVYNTLDALAQAGLSSTLRMGGAARFDPNTGPHHHAVCASCGAIVDVPADTLAPTPTTVRRLREQAPGFRVDAVERIYRGTCSACASTSSRPRAR